LTSPESGGISIKTIAAARGSTDDGSSPRLVAPSGDSVAGRDFVGTVDVRVLRPKSKTFAAAGTALVLGAGLVLSLALGLTTRLAERKAFKRAGADGVLTYFAPQAAEKMLKGE